MKVAESVMLNTLPRFPERPTRERFRMTTHHGSSLKAFDYLIALEQYVLKLMGIDPKECDSMFSKEALPDVKAYVHIEYLEGLADDLTPVTLGLKKADILPF